MNPSAFAMLIFIIVLIYLVTRRWFWCLVTFLGSVWALYMMLGYLIDGELLNAVWMFGVSAFLFLVAEDLYKPSEVIE